MVLSIQEYDKLHVRESRNLNKHQISKDDASYLQKLIIDDMPVFKWGNRCLVAQQWVGVIDLPEFSIEILPKLAKECGIDECRDILTRMLLIIHQASSTKKLPGSVRSKKNALTEVLISAFLTSLEKYLKQGMLSSYKKVQNNLDVVKGRIVFSKQFNQNILSPTRFHCSYSKYVCDNDINQFFAICLDEMQRISRDNDNLRRIRLAKASFEGIEIIGVAKALSLKIVFNSTNNRAEEPYNLGFMFLSSNFMTINTGNIGMNVMLFDMNQLYEMFMFKAMRHVYGNRVQYQNSSHYLVRSEQSGRKHIKLRPDIIVRGGDSGDFVIDTKWKLPNGFSKESDIYQMNAYSTGIGSIAKVYLLYPETTSTETFVGDYEFISQDEERRKLGIRSINLSLCTNWNAFLREIKAIFPEI